MPMLLIVVLGSGGLVLIYILIQRLPSFPSRLRDRLNRRR